MAGENQGVTAIVAAFNEAARIGRVLAVLTTYRGFAEVVVVDDGSTDDTASVASTFPVTVLRVEPNQGKGHAMDVGVDHAKAAVAHHPKAVDVDERVPDFATSSNEAFGVCRFT